MPLPLGALPRRRLGRIVRRDADPPRRDGRRFALVERASAAVFQERARHSLGWRYATADPPFAVPAGRSHRGGSRLALDRGIPGRRDLVEPARQRTNPPGRPALWLRGRRARTLDPAMAP